MFGNAQTLIVVMMRHSDHSLFFFLGAEDMGFRDVSEKILFLSFILFIPALPILGLWGFFAPVGFWQNIAMFIFSAILYPVFVIGFWIFISWLVD